MIQLSEEDLLVLAQPTMRQPDLYWKSIEDFLIFTASIASRKSNFSGESLLRLFDEAKPFLMQIQDFSNPSIPFQKIMRNVVIRYLSDARSAAIKNAEIKINQEISKFTITVLRAGLIVNFISDHVKNCSHDFKLKAQQSFPYVLKYLPTETTKQLTDLQNSIQLICNQSFVKQCFIRLIPQIQNEIVETIKREIAANLNEIDIADMGAFNFTTLSTQFEKTAESRFRNIIIQIHRDISSSSQFVQFVSRLHTNIRSYVQEVETNLKQKHLAYVEAESARKKAELDAKHQANLQKMSEEEAAKRRKIEEEKIEIIRQQKEEEVRHRIEMAQAQAKAEADLEAHKESMALMRKAAEQTEREHREMFAQVQADMRASQERMERENQEERRVQAEREQSMRSQIQQLRSQPPIVIHTGGGCNVA
jgi:hypothetical protein